MIIYIIYRVKNLILLFLVSFFPTSVLKPYSLADTETMRRETWVSYTVKKFDYDTVLKNKTYIYTS